MMLKQNALFADRILLVTFRLIIILYLWFSDKALWLVTIPFLHGLKGCFGFECRLRQLVIVQKDITQRSLPQVLSVNKAVGFQYIGNAPIKAFHHSVGLRCSGAGEAVLDAKFVAQPVKFVTSTGFAPAAGEQAVCGLVAVVGQVKSKSL